MVKAPEMIDGKQEKVELTSNLSMEEICETSHVKFSCEDGLSGITARKSELGDYLFIKNYSRTESSRIVMKNVAEHYRALDLETMTLSNITNEITLDKCGSLILVADPEALCEEKPQTVEEITKSFTVTDVTENYLVIDRASMSYDGKSWGEELPIMRLFEDLLRADYTGTLFMKHTFRTAEAVKASVLLERERYTSVTLNGHALPLEDSDFDVNFVTCDVSPYLVCGENELIYSIDYYQHAGVHFALFDPMATESVRNCLYYDTNLESVYLFGDFTVDADRVLHKRTALPPISTENYQNGYPFFKGNLTLKGEYDFDGKGSCVLSLEKGRFLMAELFINGTVTDLTLSTKKNITSLLKVGKNEIGIVLHSSLRNLFGPHHWGAMPEPVHVSPRYFTFRCTWNGGVAPDYTDVYQSVPFGLDAIEMIRS